MKNKHVISGLVIVLILCFLLAGAGSLPQTKANGIGNLYLPLVLKNFPFTPLAPGLNTIDNQDGNGSYTVSWSSSEGANIYTLQEDTTADFFTPTDIYEGSGTSTEISGMDLGTYYYRVNASNTHASSDWSNIVSATVTAAPPDCPQAGIWRGTTSQGKGISYIVNNSSACEIESGSLVVGWSTGWSEGCTGEGWTTVIIPVAINNDQFDFTDSSYNAKLDELHGTFPSSDIANGNFQVEYTVYSPYTKTCSSGLVTWNAEPFYGLDGAVEAIHIQSDGKILIGGSFRFVYGVERRYLARLNSDGTLDASFNANVGDDVYSIAQQSDGKILIGGYFETVNGVAHKSLARLNSDGSLDESFNTNLLFYPFDDSLFPINHIIVLPDGDILIEGLFNQVDGAERNYVARLNANGSLDESFNANLQWAGGIGAEIVLNVSQIYIGGVLDAAPEFFRVDQTGTVDESFPSYTYAGDLAGPIVIQADGKFVLVDGYTIVRLNSDGTSDTGFDVINTDDRALSMAVYTGGKTIVGGRFWNLDDVPYLNLCQLNADGTVNPAFSPDPNDSVYALAVQSDGKILVGGGFSEIDGAERYSFARLNADGSLDLTFYAGP